MHPRLVEHIWTVPTTGRMGVATPYEELNIDRNAGQVALAVRPHCTGFNDIATIAERTGYNEGAVIATIAAFDVAGLLLTDPGDKNDDLDIADVREAFKALTKLWGAELARDYIGAHLASTTFHRDVLFGWLLETYHYVQAFPEVIELAAWRASTRTSLDEAGLTTVLRDYAQQETGHEDFVVRALENLGFSRDEVENSTPLVSTLGVVNAMRSLIGIDPATALLIAALVEAQEHEPDQIEAYKEALHERYHIPLDALDPYFEHQRIDHELGHAHLLDVHIDKITVTQRNRLDRIVNALHDLKHAFDLQSLEIVEYYSGVHQGRYLPRQPVTFAAVQPPRSAAARRHNEAETELTLVSVPPES